MRKENFEVPGITKECKIKRPMSSRVDPPSWGAGF